MMGKPSLPIESGLTNVSIELDADFIIQHMNEGGFCLRTLEASQSILKSCRGRR
jgi:hypothetical protein